MSLLGRRLCPLCNAYAAPAVKIHTNTHANETTTKKRRIRQRNAVEKGRQAVALSLPFRYCVTIIPRTNPPTNTSNRFVCNKIEIIRPICRYCILLTSYTRFGTVHPFFFFFRCWLYGKPFRHSADVRRTVLCCDLWDELFQLNIYDCICIQFKIHNATFRKRYQMQLFSLNLGDGDHGRQRHD